MATGSITITKDARPDSFQDFTFTTSFSPAFVLDDDELSAVPNQRTFDNLPPGTYFVRETKLSDWFSEWLRCESERGTSKGEFDLTTDTLEIELAEGDSVECLFQNTYHPSRRGPVPKGDCRVTVRLLSVAYVFNDVGDDWRFAFGSQTGKVRDKFEMTLPVGATHEFDPPRELSWLEKGKAGQEVPLDVFADATELDNLVHDKGLLENRYKPYPPPVCRGVTSDRFSLTVRVRERPDPALITDTAKLRFEFEVILEGPR